MNLLINKRIKWIFALGLGLLITIAIQIALAKFLKQTWPHQEMPVTASDQEYRQIRKENFKNYTKWYKTSVLVNAISGSSGMILGILLRSNFIISTALITLGILTFLIGLFPWPDMSVFYSNIMLTLLSIFFFILLYFFWPKK